MVFVLERTKWQQIQIAGKSRVLLINVLQELKLYHFKGSLLPLEGNFWRGTRLTAVPNSKKEIHRDNPQPSL